MNLSQYQTRIEEANQRVVSHLEHANPVIKRVLPAVDVVLGMTPRTILHSGPPLEWKHMCPMLQGAILAGAVLEGIAGNLDDARKSIERGGISLSSCHERGGVAPVAGVVTASMPVFVVEERMTGAKAFAPLNEGLGRVLRYGASGEDVTQKLLWMKDVLGPVLDAVLISMDGIPAYEIMSEALHMGDECHNRQKASTNLFLKKIAPALVDQGGQSAREVAEFIGRTDVFFLNVAMAAVKATLVHVERVSFSTIVTAISQNGTHLGIRMAGTGRSWFLAKAPMIEGKYFDGYTEADANPGIGDSLITEVVGLGGVAMAAAPALARYTGGTASRMLDTTLEMYRITHSESRRFTIPQLGFRGCPIGLDVQRIIDSGVTPVCNAGIAHRKPGVGQVGAGIIRTPLAPFRAAIQQLISAA